MTQPHTPQFINEMQEKLLKEQNLLKQELESLGHLPDYGRSDEDNATEMAEYTTAVATTDASQKRLKEVQGALKRIEDGMYGLTDDGETIPEDRLRANPAATGLA